MIGLKLFNEINTDNKGIMTFVVMLQCELLLLQRRACCSPTHFQYGCCWFAPLTSTKSWYQAHLLRNSMGHFDRAQNSPVRKRFSIWFWLDLSALTLSLAGGIHHPSTNQAIILSTHTISRAKKFLRLVLFDKHNRPLQIPLFSSFYHL